MSTAYGLDFQVWAKDEAAAKRVEEKIHELWNITDLISNEQDGAYWVSAYGEQDISGPLDDRLPNFADEIMKANGEPCKIEFTIKYVEQTPSDTFYFGPGHDEPPCSICGGEILLTDGCENGPHVEDEEEA